MPFCTNCGNQISDSSRFCAKCGAPVEGEKEVSNESISQNVSSTQEVKSNTHTVNSSADAIKFLNKCKDTVSGRATTYDRRSTAYVNFSNAAGVKKSYVWMFIICIVVAFVIGNALDYSLWLNDMQWFVVVIWLGGGIGLPTLIVCGNNKTYNDNLNAFWKLNTELECSYAKDGISELSFEYSDPRIINQLISTINTGRADNLRDAINIVTANANSIFTVNKQTTFEQASLFLIKELLSPDVQNMRKQRLLDPNAAVSGLNSAKEVVSMYICPTCRGTYSGEGNNVNMSCPKCGINVINMNCTRDYWRTLNEQQKNQMKDKILK